MEWGLNLTFRDDIRELLKSDSFHRLVVCCLFVLSVCLFWSIFLREQVNTKKDLQELTQLQQLAVGELFYTQCDPPVTRKG